MRQFCVLFESMPFPLTTSVVALISAVISAIITLVTIRIQASKIRTALIVLAPVVVSYQLYWAPVRILGAPPQEYYLWQPLFLAFWSGAGIVAAILTSQLIHRWGRLAK
jgi:hypothetical protein